MRRMLAGLAAGLVGVALFSCGGDADEVARLEYVGVVAELDTNAASMDVAFDGTVFTAEMLQSKVARFGPDGRFQGNLEDGEGHEILATSFFVDRSNLVNVASTGLFSKNRLYRFRTDGTLFDARDLADYPQLVGLPLSANGNAVAADGTLLLAATQVKQLASMRIAVVSKDLEVEATLEGAALAAMIPDFAAAGAAEAAGFLTGIGPGAGGEILVTVERDADAVDGVLVLNPDLTKKRWVGGDWLFNGPWDVAVDANGLYYVVSRFNGNVKVFDADWKQVAETDPNDAADGRLKQPIALRLRGGDLYVLDFRGAEAAKKYQVHKFKTLEPCAAETPEAEPEPVVPQNAPPVIEGIDLVAQYDHDVDGNYLGGRFTYSARASDPDGDTLSYAWELLESGGPGGATLSPSGTTALVVADSFGSGQVKLTVTDGEGGSATLVGGSYGPP